MRQGVLSLWLHGELLGEVQRLPNGSNRLRFTAEALQKWGTGTRLLSYSLPLTPKRVEGEVLDDYLDNLLPEGPVRVQLEQQHGLRPGDSFGLLAHIGAECAGAVQLSSEDVRPTGRLAVLPDDEVNRIVMDLPALAPPAGESVTASLGGVQSKILLTRTETGWAWPADGAMSSHILKPEPTNADAPVPEIVEYEHWAMQVAKASGIPAARTELIRFGDRLTLVVERYDRESGHRIHQEDFAQALGIRPGNKYEPGNEPSSRLSRISAGPGAESISRSAFREELLRLVAFNLLVGNGDAHAKNYSMFLRNGVFSLAPAYDVAPVFCVNTRFSNFGMRLAGQGDLRYLTIGQLVEESSSWGLTSRRAEDVVHETADAVLTAIAQVPASPVVADVVARVHERIGRLLATP